MEMMENKAQTLMAFARLGCTVIASGAAMAGFAVDADALFTGAAMVIALICYVWSWWKNNNVTTAATDAQEILDLIKLQDGMALDPSELDGEEDDDE